MKSEECFGIQPLTSYYQYSANAVCGLLIIDTAMESSSLACCLLNKKAEICFKWHSFKRDEK